MDTVNKKKFIKYTVLMVLFLVLAGGYMLLKREEKTAAELLLAEFMILFGYMAAVWDGLKKRVPNKIILCMITCWLIIVIPQILIVGDSGYNLIISGLIGFFAGGGITLFVYLVSKKGLGGGDVKFCAAAGCYVGMVNLLSGIFFGSILAVLVNAVLMIAGKRKRTDCFAFIPYINLGIMVVLFLS